jgi:hypothetical protein
MRAMTRKLSLLALVAAVLAGCDSSPETITGGGPADPRDANQLANAVANVQLPPAIVASHKYRCGDNSVVAIDWLSDGTINSARATPDGGSGINLAQAEAGGDYTAEGTTLKGDPTAASITFNGKSCKR